jgi:thymidylate kinase
VRTLTVALVGADGAGKSTVARRLAAELGVPAAYVYMGVNLEASGLALPHTRLYLQWKRRRGGRPDLAGPPDPDRRRPPPSGGPARLKASLRSSARIANLLAEEWFRQLVVWGHTARGRVVLCDRHFYADYFFHDIAAGNGLPRARRLHGWVLRRWYPKPDLIVCLDAPSELIHARKREGTPESLERRRREYLALGAHVARFAVVDASQPTDDVVSQVRQIVLRAQRDAETRARLRRRGRAPGRRPRVVP